jgi:hypothetical protein
MRRILAFIVVIGLSVGIAGADDKPASPPTSDYSQYLAQREARRAKAAQVALQNDSRLATLTNAPPRKVGILTYHPNKGGGYTFLHGSDIVFYALPYTPSTYKCEIRTTVCKPMKDGGTAMVFVTDSINVATVGPSKVPFGGQTVYRTEMSGNGKDGFFRQDMRLAYWSRDTSDGDFHFWILADDSETRLKLKSIVPVLEHAEHDR